MKKVTKNGWAFNQVIEVGNQPDSDAKMTITSAKLNRGPYYFTIDLKYEMETPSEIREFHFPAIQLPISSKKNLGRCW